MFNFYSTVKNIAQNIIAFKWRRLHRMSSTKREPTGKLLRKNNKYLILYLILS